MAMDKTELRQIGGGEINSYRFNDVNQVLEGIVVVCRDGTKRILRPDVAPGTGLTFKLEEYW